MFVNRCLVSCTFFFFNDTATTEIYTLSLHDALPISAVGSDLSVRPSRFLFGQSSPLSTLIIPPRRGASASPGRALRADRKSTRLNSSHANISYAVFCLKKKKNTRLHPV